MTQMTVERLLNELNEAVRKDPSILNKKVVVPDDNEGNGYHGVFYSITTNPEGVKGNIEVSNGLYDSQETDYNNIVIIG